MKTNADLKTIAIDLYEGRIFTSDMVGPHNTAGLIFMPLLFGAFKDKTEDEKKDIALIYEYYDKAGPRGINGKPIFTSLQWLNREEFALMIPFFEAYKKLKEEFEKTP